MSDIDPGAPRPKNEMAAKLKAEFLEEAEQAAAVGDHCEAAYYRRRAEVENSGYGIDRDSFEDGWTACEEFYGHDTEAK